MKEEFKKRDAEIGHLKFVLTSSGKALWANVTQLAAEPHWGGEPLAQAAGGTLIVNARVSIAPEELERIVRNRLEVTAGESGLHAEVLNLQCFSPAYPQPPYVIRQDVA